MGLVVGVIMVYAWLTIQTRLLEGEIAVVEGRLNDPELRTSIERIKFLEKQMSALQPRVALLQKVQNSERGWIQVLRDVMAAIPPDVWVTAIQSRRTEKEHQLVLRGSALALSSVGDFMLQLHQADWCGETNLGFGEKNTIGGTSQRAVAFEVVANLKEPIGSQP
jgi:Tfp pilus assembly protein PilN